MARMADAIGFFAPEVEVLRFPAWDCLPYDRVSPNPEIVAERVATLTRLLEPPTRPRILLTTVNALAQKVPPPATFQGATMTLTQGRARAAGGADRLPGIERLPPHRHGDGTRRIRRARRHRRPVPGRRVRPGAPRSVRRRDRGSCAASTPATQRSGKVVPELRLRPVGEVFLDEASRARFRTAYRELFGAAAAEDPLYVSVSAGRKHPGMEHWAGLFHDHMATLIDYLPGASVSLDHQAEDVATARFEMVADHYEARRVPVRIAEGEVPYRPAPPGTLHLDARRLE